MKREHDFSKAEFFEYVLDNGSGTQIHGGIEKKLILQVAESDDGGYGTSSR